MSTTVDVPSRIGNFTVTLYHKVTNNLHSVHNFVDADIREVIDLAKKEVQEQADPTGSSQAHIGYGDNYVAAVTDTATGEGVEAPRELTETEKLTTRLDAAEANLKRYEALFAAQQQRDAENGVGVAVAAPAPYVGPSVPQTPHNVPDSPVDAPSPNVSDGPTIPPRDNS